MIALIVSSLNVYAQSNETTAVSTEYRSLGKFNIIIVICDIDLIYKPSIDSIGIVKIVTAKDNLKNIAVKNSKGELTVKNKGKSDEKVIVYVYSLTINTLNNKDNGNILRTEKFNTNYLNLYTFNS